MSTDSPERETTALEEAIISNMWEIAAIVEVLERKGLAAHPIAGPRPSIGALQLFFPVHRHTSRRSSEKYL
jgi:hypothetical protein